MNAAEWFRSVRECYGPLPEHYLVLDTETTGLNTEQDLIVQLGWCEVRDRRVVDNGGVVLNWLDPDHPLIERGTFLSRLERTRSAMASRGNAYPWTPAVIRQGQDPMVALAELLVRLRDECLPAMVTHNGWCFDVPMLESHFRRFLYRDYTFPHQRLWDTGALEKGSQLSVPLRPGESQRELARRVMGRISRVKWSLANHCVPKYQLAAKHNLDLAQAHTAPFDCLVTHHLIETFREFMDYRPRRGGKCTGLTAATASTST